MQMKISLSEALTGFSRTVTTLDGSKIAVTQIPGDFVKHEGLLGLLLVAFRVGRFRKLFFHVKECKNTN